MKIKNICILGLGYIGLPTASTFATHGLKVVGVDTNDHVVDSLRREEIHIYEPGLRTLVQAAIRSGNLIVQSKPAIADAFIIAVPTPIHPENKKSDMSYVISATESIVPYLQRGNLVILESTSPPRTTIDLVAPILERSGLRAGEDFHLVYSPERVLPGRILQELIENVRVMGGIDRKSAEAGRDLYRVFARGDIILTEATTAEMVKLMENTTRDINIAIANEFSRLADRFGVNIWDAIRIANLHPRINILNPGPGVGGHCVSVDPWFLVEAAPDLASLIYMGRLVNDAQPRFVLQLIQQACSGEVSGRRIAVMGLTYKPDVDDFRESPSIEIVKLLNQSGAEVTCYEPFYTNQVIEGVSITTRLETAVEGAEVLVILVAHQEIRQLDAAQLSQLTNARIVVDAVNIGKDWENEGFELFRLGVGKTFRQGAD